VGIRGKEGGNSKIRSALKAVPATGGGKYYLGGAASCGVEERSNALAAGRE